MSDEKQRKAASKAKLLVEKSVSYEFHWYFISKKSNLQNTCMHIHWYTCTEFGNSTNMMEFTSTLFLTNVMKIVSYSFSSSAIE